MGKRKNPPRCHIFDSRLWICFSPALDFVLPAQLRALFRPFFAPLENPAEQHQTTKQTAMTMAVVSPHRQQASRAALKTRTERIPSKIGSNQKRAGIGHGISIQCHKPHLLLSKIVLMWGGGIKETVARINSLIFRVWRESG